jgi:hypothetical protein
MEDLFGDTAGQDIDEWLDALDSDSVAVLNGGARAADATPCDGAVDGNEAPERIASLQGGAAAAAATGGAGDAIVHAVGQLEQRADVARRQLHTQLASRDAAIAALQAQIADVQRSWDQSLGARACDAGGPTTTSAATAAAAVTAPSLDGRITDVLSPLAVC